MNGSRQDDWPHLEAEQSHRARILLPRYVVLLLAGLAVGLPVGRGRAESVIPLLGRFDAEQLEAVYPPDDAESLGELAKLIYRIRALDPEVLAAKASGAARAIGEAAQVDGRIRKVRSVAVPPSLVEYLEFSNLQIVDLEVGRSKVERQASGGELQTDVDSQSDRLAGQADAASGVRLITAELPRDAKPGDRVAGVGVLIETVRQPQAVDAPATAAVFAAPRIRWYPQSPPNVGWQLLSQAGVDISELAGLASRNRMPLISEDGDAFYAMLAAANALASRESLPAPEQVTAVMLLGAARTSSSSSPSAAIGRPVGAGDWVQIPLQTVQITRVAVTDPKRQKTLGSDRYFQIDAVADLGKVDVRIERAEGQQGSAATFENRYPVSLVTAELPEFLRRRVLQKMGGDATVADVSEAISVDAFYFRLWSYSTDYMDQFGGGDQIGPLLVASRIRQRATVDDPAGVRVIGWIAAGGVLTAIVAIVIWNSVLAGRDRRVKAKRSDSESQRIELPDLE